MLLHDFESIQLEIKLADSKGDSDKIVLKTFESHYCRSRSLATSLLNQARILRPNLRNQSESVDGMSKIGSNSGNISFNSSSHIRLPEIKFRWFSRKLDQLS